MRCKKDEFVQGSMFHLYNHSVNEINLFNERDDYLYFLSKMKKKLIPKEVEIFAYCLMPNHYHFCIRQNSETPIYSLINSIAVSYSHHFNSKYKRKGKLFFGKLQHKRIKDEKYLIQLCKYIHFNPVKAGIVKSIEDWEFSNYSEYIGKRIGNPFSQKLVELFPDNFKKYDIMREEYEKNYRDREFQKLLFE
jgi:putative transposase